MKRLYTFYCFRIFFRVPAIFFLVLLTGQTNIHAAPLLTPSPNKESSFKSMAKTLAEDQITSFSLINADNESTIRTITNNATIDLATLATNNLNIRANTSPAEVGSVRFTLSGAASRTHVESTAPYAVFGENEGNYYSWTPEPGKYTLTATPYSNQDGTGTAGTSLTLNFTIKSSTPPPSSSLVTNVKATTGNSYKLGQLTKGTVFYTDRNYQITSVPTTLNNALFIKTPNDDKYVTATSVLSFSVNKTATVYVAYDPLATKLPAWLSTWEKTADRIGINDPRISFLQVYQKRYPVGTVKLGGNLASPAVGSKNTYLVVIKPGGSVVNKRPYASAVRPADGATNVALDKSISVDLEYPGGNAINGKTVNTATVKLFKISSTGSKTQVGGTAVNSSAAGDAITLSATLARNTVYEFHITDQVKDDKGNAFIPFTSRFSTSGASPGSSEGIAFTEKTLITNSFGANGFTTLVVGPDHRLYATTSAGKIERWDIKSDGTITNHVTISPFGSSRRLLIGLCFDPAATSSNLVAWISHSSPLFVNAPDWSGKISRIVLNKPSNISIKDYVINLPRSYKDHSTNSLAFGPDKALYFPQGSNSAMGAADGAWGNRPERLLSGSLLRLDIAKAQRQSLPINVKTQDGGNYNPYASSAALTIYATGIRNAFDLVWHTNGQLYVPANGSAAGGNIPALASGAKRADGTTYNGSTIPAITNVRDTQNDYLFRVVKGGYYGHPNILRKEYILNGGNPTSGTDPGEVVWKANGQTFGYRVGTQKEPNYRGWAFDFGLNMSPNGVIEYRSNAFGGKLKGRLLVCRFSGGDDIMVLEPGGTSKNIVKATEGIKVPGFRRPFANPLDLTEDPKTGNIYLSEYYDGNGNGKPRITLLKPVQTSSSAATEMVASAVTEVKEKSLEVYPNPTTEDAIFAEAKNFTPHEEITLTLYDLAGLPIYSALITANHEGTASTDISPEKNLNPGVYILRATAASGEKQTRLFIR
ncbi:Ig-like domain-containing protein [Adhaeribacter swui]|uniref:Ig-like domain-containing protein n=1 Tax=Adhaeribacter swui TaxID=2086471 RepID=A0A7G7G990_9BACT|nr:Ig-like domain-containing protein [Adhaeribacter swui]QNF33724.1 Ig-like domain-containing protein [Adhaeribacter swui]